MQKMDTEKRRGTYRVHGASTFRNKAEAISAKKTGKVWVLRKEESHNMTPLPCRYMVAFP